ncbi:hypothetical protein CF326_g7127 [Tilletia indica]|nr:hypothetical protein CF326_g7127 [Tilletia indica]
MHGQAEAVQNQGRVDHQKAVKALADERKKRSATAANDGGVEAGVPTLVAGDFNAYHKDWSTEGTAGKRGAGGIKLKSWAMAGDWQLGLEAGTVTRGGSAGEQDSAIDLVFLSPALHSSGWKSQCSARVDLATGSDHYPLVTILRPPQPFEPIPTKRPLNIKRTNWERFAQVLKDQQINLDESMDKLAGAESEADVQRCLDAAFVELQRLIASCLEVTTLRCTGSSTGCQFWDAECDQRLDEMRMAELELAQARADGVREQPTREKCQQAKGLFEKQLAKSKRASFDERINELSGNNIFAAMNWSGAWGRKATRHESSVGW